MREAEGFLLVFSITQLSSLTELNELREQLQHVKNDPNVPIVLVGNKADLEEDRKVSRSRAFGVSQAWGNVPYYETSARRKQNVNEVFVDVCRQIIMKNGDDEEDGPVRSGGRGQREGGGTFRRRRRDRERDRGPYHARNEDYRIDRARRRERSRCVIF